MLRRVRSVRRPTQRKLWRPGLRLVWEATRGCCVRPRTDERRCARHAPTMSEFPLTGDTDAFHCCLGAVALALFLGAAPVSAQTMDEMRDELKRLRAEVNELRLEAMSKNAVVMDDAGLGLGLPGSGTFQAAENTDATGFDRGLVTGTEPSIDKGASGVVIAFPVPMHHAGPPHQQLEVVADANLHTAQWSADGGRSPARSAAPSQGNSARSLVATAHRRSPPRAADRRTARATAVRQQASGAATRVHAEPWRRARRGAGLVDGKTAASRWPRRTRTIATSAASLKASPEACHERARRFAALI